MNEKWLMYTRGTSKDDWGVALYDYEYCTLVVEFYAEDSDSAQAAYDQLDDYIEAHNVQLVDY